MAKVRKTLAVTFGFAVLLVIADDYCISSLGERWKPDNARILEFSKELARSYSDFSKLTFSEMPCEEVGRFLWYNAEICAIYQITPRDCEQPSATIVYVPPQPVIFQPIVPHEEHRIMAGSQLEVVSPDGEFCPTEKSKDGN